MTHEGACACRQVSYRLTSDPLFVHACHCKHCQCQSGSAFVLNALIETDRIDLLSGKTTEIMTPTASGKGQRIIRCSACQTAVWSHYAYGKLDDAIAFVRVGTLAEPSRVPPDLHIFTESKQSWLSLPAGTAAVPQFYRASEHWSPESIERRTALFRSLEA